MIIGHLLIISIVLRCSQSLDVYGPGLFPDKLVMPARYFFISLTSNRDWSVEQLAKSLEVNVTGKTKFGNCRVWVNKIGKNDGTFIVRYKTYETCYDFSINIYLKDQHIGDSPYYFKGPIYADQCYCPEPDFNKWLKDYGCNTYKQIQSDLKNFQTINMRESLPAIIKNYHRPESTSFCHYVIKKNKLHRKCYGKHVGFNMFADNILLFLARRVIMPDLELVINLGDWPLVHIKKEPLPIFSWCGSQDSQDIIMPTYDITESTLENMGRVTLDTLSVQGGVKVPWVERENRAIWRGRDSRLERLQLIDIARANPHLINASLTNFFFYRDKQDKYGPAQPHISFFKFFDYKYQINVDGTVAAYRLPYLLAGGGMVFKQDSPYYEHFYPLLEKWKHYVPVKRDLSDLVEKILWARNHDEEAKNIAQNAQKFASEHLMPQHILCYHAILFQEWSKRLKSEVSIQEGMTHVPQTSQDCSCESQTFKDEL